MADVRLARALNASDALQPERAAQRRSPRATRPVASERPVISVDWVRQDWADLVPRLLLLAAARLARMSWRGGRGGWPGQPEDFVNEAIAKTIHGVRPWPQEACTLYQHLAGVVVSDIADAADAADHRLTVAGGLDAKAGPRAAQPDQEQLAVWRSEQRRFLNHVEDIDPVLAEMAVQMLIRDVQDTESLATALKIPPAEVGNLRKRLRRAARIYRRQVAT